MRLKALMTELAARLDWEALPEPGKSGEYVLEFEDGPRVECLEQPGQGLLLSARVRDLPDDPAQREALLRRVLSLALGRLKTRREVLSLDAQAETLRLHRLLPGNVHLDGFHDALETFLNGLDFWRRNGEDAESVSSAPPSPFSVLFS
jgi:hypothetical protein